MNPEFSDTYSPRAPNIIFHSYLPLTVFYMRFLNGAIYIYAVINRAHSFPQQNLTNSAANLVNSAAHRGKADEIPRLTMVTQLNFRGLIKS